MTLRPRALSGFFSPHLLWILIPAFFYFKTFCPSLVGHDGDEFLFQAYQNGISHPAGYPVYIWIGHLLMRLTGNALYTMDLLSLLSTLLALVILFRLFRLLDIPAWQSGFMTAFFGCMPFIWEYAIESRMYNVNLLFLVLVFLIFYLYDRDEKDQWLAAGAALYGISLGVWFGNFLMAPAILAYFLLKSFKHPGRIGRVALFSGIAFLSAAGPLLYILWRSKTLPPLGTWHNPDSVTNLILFLVKTDSFVADFHPLEFAKDRFFDYVWTLLKSVGFVGIVPVIWGAAFWTRKNLAFSAFLLVSFAANFIFFAAFYPTRYTALSLSYLAIVLFMAKGLKDMLDQIKGPAVLHALAAAVLLWVQIGFVQSDFNIHSKGNRILEQSTALLRRMPPDAYLFAEWDKFTSLICVQKILGVRPDVKIYELSYQPRNYIEGGKKVQVRSFVLIDELLSKPEKPPVFSTILTDDMVRGYRGEILEKRLFRLKERTF